MEKKLNNRLAEWKLQIEKSTEKVERKKCTEITRAALSI